MQSEIEEVLKTLILPMLQRIPKKAIKMIENWVPMAETFETKVNMLSKSLQAEQKGNMALREAYNAESDKADSRLFELIKLRNQVEALQKLYAKVPEEIRKEIEAKKTQQGGSAIMKNPEMIPIDKLKAFENHPYRVEENEEMEQLTQSIKENGILSPLIVRPIDNGEYEIISGHRRLFAGKRAELTEVPAFVTELDRDKATIVLVDSNLHREHLLPSEKAFAYKMKVEAMNRQGERTDLTSSQVGKRLNTYDVIAEESGESRNQIHRYIRLTKLLPKLLEYVDEGRIAFTPAVELSYLNDIEQQDLIEIIESEDCTPSLSQAVRMKN